MKKLILMTLGLVIAVVFAFGCGSGEDEATSADEPASAPLSKAQFIQQADAICAKNRKQREVEIGDWQTNYPEGRAKAEVNVDAALKEVVAPSYKLKAESLETLVPPAQDEAAVSRMIERLSKAAEILEEDGAGGRIRSRLSQFEKEAVAYGLNACSYG